MKLKYPDSEVDFVVEPRYFLGVFDVYDREETLGAELDRVDPNDSKQLTELLRRRFFEGPRVAKLSAEHKVELTRVLKRALDENYDFAKLFDAETDHWDCFSLPGSWQVRNPRAFFEEIYRLAGEYWGLKSK
jgi:hypothetical protein